MTLGMPTAACVRGYTYLTMQGTPISISLTVPAIQVLLFQLVT